jgi:hypothetical protein
MRCCVLDDGTLTLQLRAGADGQLTVAALPPLRVGVIAKWLREEAACMIWLREEAGCQRVSVW